MKKRLKILIWNFRYIVKYKIVYALLFVVLVWSGVINTVGKSSRETMIPFVLFIDLAIIGFYFIGAIILLEKSERTVFAVVCTPLKKSEFLNSKIIAFTILSVVCSFLMVVISKGDCKINYLLLLVGIILCSVNYSIFGLIAIVQYDSLTEYLVPSWAYLFVTQLPLLNFFHVIPKHTFLSVLLDLLPTAAPLNIMKMSFGNLSVSKVIFSFITYGVWNVILYRIMIKRFDKYIIGN